MESTARIGSHPIHPMLIPYPFALLTGALAFDTLARVTGRDAFEQTARHLGIAGLGSAALAAVPGLVDYVGSVPAGTPAARHGAWHAVANLSAVSLFAVAQARRTGNGVPDVVLGLELLATGLLSLGGLLGSTLVYDDRIGVNTPANLRLESTPPSSPLGTLTTHRLG